MDNKFSYHRGSVGRWLLHCLRSFKVTDFGTNQKPVCNFLLVNNTNLYHISNCFQATADYWSNCAFDMGSTSL